MMSLQEQIDNIVRLGEKLSHSDLSVRRKAIEELRLIFDAARKNHKSRTLDSEIMPAFRIHTFLSLAQAIRKEMDNDILLEMLGLALQIQLEFSSKESFVWTGTFIFPDPSMDPYEVEMTKALVEKLTVLHEIVNDESLNTHVERMMHISPIAHLIVGTLCLMRPAARLYSIQESYKIQDYLARLDIVAGLAAGVAGFTEAMHLEAMFLLADSSREDDWNCLCELSHVFAEKVPRTELKSALVKVWHKAQRPQKDSISYTLRRRGFTRFLNWWV